MHLEALNQKVGAWGPESGGEYLKALDQGVYLRTLDQGVYLGPWIRRWAPGGPGSGGGHLGALDQGVYLRALDQDVCLRTLDYGVT